MIQGVGIPRPGSLLGWIGEPRSQDYPVDQAGHLQLSPIELEGLVYYLCLYAAVHHGLPPC
jgi:hypothetical protein